MKITYPMLNKSFQKGLEFLQIIKLLARMNDNAT